MNPRPAIAPSQARMGGEEADFDIREGTKYFHGYRILFLVCRLVQCISVSIILFFPRRSFNRFLDVKHDMMAMTDPALLINFVSNLSIACGALIHNLICYLIYIFDRARLPFFIYAAIVDFIASNGFLGLFLTAIVRGGAGLGILYQVLCVLAWVSFLICSFMEISLVCVFNFLQKQLKTSSRAGYMGERTTMNPPPQHTMATAQRDRPVRTKRNDRNVTVETVDDSADAGRNNGHISSSRRLDATHLSQATTIAEILQEAVSDPEHLSRENEN